MIITNFIKKERVIVLAILLLYLLSGFNVTIGNDGTSNIEQIEALDIWSRSSHFSFHLFGVGFYILFSKWLGLGSEFSVQLMLSLFSVAGAYSLFYVVLQRYSDQLLAYLSLIVYAFSTGVFRFSVQAEYLVLVPSFCLIALALYANKKFILSGISFAFGLFTSPFVFLFAPALLLFNTRNNFFKKKNFLFVVSFVLMYGTVSVFTFQEATTGQWSYKQVYEAYKIYLGEMNYLRVAAIYLYGYLRSFLFLLPLVGYGLYIMFNKDRNFFYITLIVAIFHLPAAIPEARYGGYQLTFYPFVAIIGSVALRELWLDHKKALALSMLSLYILTNTFIVLTERAFHRKLKDTYVQLQNDPNIPDGAVLFIYQAAKPIQVKYAPKLEVVSMLSLYQEEMVNLVIDYDRDRIGRMVEENENLFLLESGVSMPDDHIKLLFASFVSNQGAKVKGFGRERLQPYHSEAEYVLLEDYPVAVYKILK